MRFKIDENLGRAAARRLVGAGHDATTVFEQGMQGASDAALIAVCTAEGRCLVTLDKQFANPLIYPPASHAGVILLRLPDRSGEQDLLAVVDLLLPHLSSRSGLEGKIWVASTTRLRVFPPESDRP